MRLSHTQFESKGIVSEAATQRRIQDYLTGIGAYHARINVGGLRRKGVWTPSGATKGVSDLVAIIKGVVYWIEVKKVGEKQNPDQIEFQKNVEANGGIYVLAYSVNDLRAHLGR